MRAPLCEMAQPSEFLIAIWMIVATTFIILVFRIELKIRTFAIVVLQRPESLLVHQVPSNNIHARCCGEGIVIRCSRRVGIRQTRLYQCLFVRRGKILLEATELVLELELVLKLFTVYIEVDRTPEVIMRKSLSLPMPYSHRNRARSSSFRRHRPRSAMTSLDVSST